MNVGAQPLVSGYDFLSRQTRGWGPGMVEDVRWGKVTAANGVVFDTLEYRLPSGELGCGAAGDVGSGYLLVFKFNAKTADDMKAMVDSLGSVAKAP